MIFPGSATSILIWKKTCPSEIYEILRQAAVKAYESEAFQTFAEQKTFVPMGLTGQEANDWAKSTSYINSWMLYDMGFTSTSPETFGWPHP